MNLRRAAALTMVAALITVAVPILAQAAEFPQYYLGESETPIGGETEAVEVETQPPKGEGLKLTMSNGTELGPCNYTGEVTAWNDKGQGKSRIDKVSFTTPCDTSIGAACKVTGASAAGLPWDGILVYTMGSVPTDEIGTKAKPLTFSYTLGANCGGLSNTTVTATATGPVPAQSTGGGCFKFTKAGTFNLSIKGVTGTIDAEECRKNLEAK